MGFGDRLRNLKEDSQKLEREKEEKVVQEIERKNQAIRRYSGTIKKVCNEFCKGVSYKLKVVEYSRKREDLRFWKVKEIYFWTLYLGPKETRIIPVECHADHVRIYPHSESSNFDEILLPFADFSEEKLAKSLETAYKQENGLAPRAPRVSLPAKIANWRDLIILKGAEYIVEDFNLGRDGLADIGFVLTNQRLIVLRIVETTEIDGRESISFTIQKEFPLESVKDVSYGNHRTSVHTDEGEYDCGLDSTIYFSSGGPNRKFVNERDWGHSYFKKLIIEQKGARATVAVDFSFLKSVMEKGGIVLTTLTCPKCNAPLQIPTGGTETVCQHCGSAVFAQDIFKKLKTLLS